MTWLGGLLLATMSVWDFPSRSAQKEPSAEEAEWVSVPLQAKVGMTAVLEEKNISWDRRSGCFVANLQLEGELGAGNAGDLYVNRDRAHSDLKIADFPGLTRAKLGKSGVARGKDTDLPNMSYPYPVFGNCSRALTSGAYWRSLPRLMMTGMASGMGSWHRFYRENQTWVFPAVNDHPPFGKKGDLFASVTPYWFVTQGRSWSDQYYLRAALEVSRSLPPETKRAAVERGLLAATIQMVVRRSLKNVLDPTDYLCPLAHPTAFPANGLDLERLKQLAAELKPETLPPVVQFAGLTASRTDYKGKLPELTYLSPCAMAMVLRGEEPERTFLIRVAGGADYTMNQVHGDPRAVKIERLSPAVFRLTVTKAYLTPTLRVDVAAFAKSATSDWGAPSFFSLAVVDVNAEYFDPVLTGVVPPPEPPKQSPPASKR